jgi:HK97 family phage prohead protease
MSQGMQATGGAPLLVGQFDGYASLFGVPDLARDVVLAGAFQDSLAQRGGAGGVRLLWQHDPREPLGVFTHIQEDRRGLYVRGALNLQVGRGQDLFALLRQGAVAGLSIGYKPVRARRDALTGQRHLLQVDLWEVSLVTFPLLPAARVLRVADRPAQGQRAVSR